MDRLPRIYSIPLENTGTHETFVIVINQIPQSVDTFNFVQDEKGNRTFFVSEGTFSLHFRAGSRVQVIR